jgi:SAM-dependent methyltransferase
LREDRGVTPDDVAALRAPAGQAVLAAIGAYDEATTLATATRLRALGHDPALVGTALTQARLRRRAGARLGAEAEHWWFTADGLEQATRPEVAGRRAGRLAATGVASVADLGCGIGADTVAVARAGLRVEAVEADPATAAVAAANVAAAGVADRVTVHCADARLFDATAVDAVFCDPARRAAGRRISNPEGWSPPWSFVAGLAQRLPVVAKVAPGIPHDLPPATAATEWVSVHGDLVEACVWFAPTDRSGRRAVLLPSGEEVDDQDLPTPIVGPPGPWVVEPDDAIIRAGLVARIAADLAGHLLDPRIAYVTTSDTPLPSPRYRRFEVLDQLPFSLKLLRERLRAAGAGDVTVKKRGMAIDPIDLRRRLRPDPAAGEPLTVLLTRIGAAPTAFIARSH